MMPPEEFCAICRASGAYGIPNHFEPMCEAHWEVYEKDSRYGSSDAEVRRFIRDKRQKQPRLPMHDYADEN